MLEVNVTILLLTCALAVFLVKLAKVSKAYKKKWVAFRKLPGPKQTPYPPLGHAMMLLGDSSEFYAALLGIIKNDIHANKREVGCVWFGPEPFVLVAGPNAVEVLLRSSEHMEKSFMYKFFEPWLGTGLLTSGGEKWKSRRKLLTPSFHFSILTEFLKSMNAQSSIFVNKLDKYAKTGESFNIFKPITLCALDIICETAMGEHIHAQECGDSEYVKALNRSTELLLQRWKTPWLWMNFTFRISPQGREFRKRLKVLQDFTKSVIEDRMSKFDSKSKSNGKRRLAFLDLLIDVSKKTKSFNMGDIAEEVDTFMFEGHDTTSSGIAWAMQLIGSFPEVQKGIHVELDKIFGNDLDRLITTEDLRKMEYLDIVIKESLRILSAVPMIARVTTSDCRMDGEDIPAGTTCLILIQAINNYPEYWSEPEKFIPERFTMENSEGRHPYAYVPFSAGPRNCIGQKFALMEAKVVLIHLLRKFEIKSCEKTEDIRKMADSILRPANGIKVKLSKRKEIFND